MQPRKWQVGWVLGFSGLLLLGLGSTRTMAEEQAEVATEDHLSGEDGVNDSAHESEHGGDSHAGGHGSTNPVTFAPDLAIVTAVIFLTLLAVLWKFAWGPVVEALDKREKTVADQLADAQHSQDEARRLLDEHETRLAGASSEVKQMLDQARRDSEIQKQEILNSAQAAASAERDRAVREIHAAKNAALQELAQKSVNTAVDLAGQIVQRQLNSDDHQKLIGEALKQFSNDN